MKLLGLTGKKKVGKDTVYTMLRKQYPKLRTIRVGFADALKQEVSAAIGKPISYIDANKDNFRLILQGWGTDFRRKLCGEDYWTDKLLKKLVSLDDTQLDLVVVADVRFHNEAKMIQDVGGKIWRIVRDNGTEDKHASEVEQLSIKVDFVIYNNHSLLELEHNTQIAYQQTLL